MSNESKLLQIANEATFVFTKSHKDAAVSCGSASRALQQNATRGDSVVIDCMKTNVRIVLLILDQQPNVFAIGIGSKATPDDIEFDQLPQTELSSETVLKYMEANFKK